MKLALLGGEKTLKTKIIIDAIYHKKITLEDLFLTILSNGGNA